MAHAGSEQWNEATRHARLRGRLQQVGKCLSLENLFNLCLGFDTHWTLLETFLSAVLPPVG